MTLADRIAAWFGYVPAKASDWTVEYEFTDEQRYSHPTITSLTPSQILVTADSKRGHPCS